MKSCKTEKQETNWTDKFCGDQVDFQIDIGLDQIEMGTTPFGGNLFCWRFSWARGGEDQFFQYFKFWREVFGISSSKGEGEF